jgi:hypothetical protein
MNPTEQRQRASAISQLKADVSDALEEAQVELNDIVQHAVVEFKKLNAENKANTRAVADEIQAALAKTEAYVEEKGKEIRTRIGDMETLIIDRTPPPGTGWRGRWERLKWAWAGN